VVLTSIAFPSARADEPVHRQRGVAGWWHKQTRLFMNRRQASSKPTVRSRSQATLRAPRRVESQGKQPQPAAAPRLARQPAIRPVQHRMVRRVVAQAPRVPANQPPVAPTTAGFASLGAPLYPSPVQNIPHQVGGVVITNPALAPHEMLYEHEYRALYPPFYYKVNGWWAWTPFGVESHDKWELIGTEVRVRYKAKSNLLQKLTDPFIEPFID